MFKQIKKDLIINTAHVVYYDTDERRLEMSTGEELFVDEEFKKDLLRAFGEINCKERP